MILNYPQFKTQILNIPILETNSTVESDHSTIENSKLQTYAVLFHEFVTGIGNKDVTIPAIKYL